MSNLVSFRLTIFEDILGCSTPLNIVYFNFAHGLKYTIPILSRTAQFILNLHVNVQVYAWIFLYIGIYFNLTKKV